MKLSSLSDGLRQNPWPLNRLHISRSKSMEFEVLGLRDPSPSPIGAAGCGCVGDPVVAGTVAAPPSSIFLLFLTSRFCFLLRHAFRHSPTGTRIIAMEALKKSPSSSSPKKSAFSRFCSKLSVKKGKREEEERVIKNASSSDEEAEASSSSSRKGKNSSECLERVFTYFDSDGDGRVSPAELQRGVRAVGGELSAEEAEMAVRLSDSDGDGLLGLEDFAKLMEGKGVEEERKEGELMEAFKMYEMEGTGEITPKSLKRMLGRLGESATMESCKAMIMRFDINGDGVLSFEEFKVMMMQQQA
nr:putative calcium-binding protein CML19 [Ipomoea batatas]GMD24400.1 putative calcium-binding protein CML19 [Ipomoea batatas]GME04149.1 putative calcium-binding protein CML19 [Ipomoea batatas]